jgi:hypothetical protein
MLEAALAYAQRGIPAFPCAPRTKKPLVKPDVMITRTTPPANIVGGYRFPEAPEVDLGAPTVLLDRVPAALEPKQRPIRGPPRCLPTSPQMLPSYRPATLCSPTCRVSIGEYNER